MNILYRQTLALPEQPSMQQPTLEPATRQKKDLSLEK